MWKLEYNTAHHNGGRWRSRKFETFGEALETEITARGRYDHNICTKITDTESGWLVSDCRCRKEWCFCASSMYMPLGSAAETCKASVKKAKPTPAVRPSARKPRARS